MSVYYRQLLLHTWILNICVPDNKAEHIATDLLETMKSQRSDLSGDDVVKVLMDSVNI